MAKNGASFIALACIITIAIAVDFSVYYDQDTKKFHLSQFKVDSASVAYGSCEYTLDTKGWHQFVVKTNSSFPDEIQMKAIGYADGKCFQQSIFNHYKNMEWWNKNKKALAPEEEIYQFLHDNEDYVRNRSSTFKTKFWRQVGLVLAQFDGLVIGYSENAPSGQELSKENLWWYQSLGDIGDISKHLKPHMPMNADLEDPTLDDHCSGLVAIAPGNKELFIAQDTWSPYSSMTRVMKTIEMNVNEPTTKAHKIVFSSYPGFVQSYDDFMLSDQQLVHLETTNSINDTTLFELCTPKSVLTWIRNRVAMQGASSGIEWVELFRQENSGTYNNQWQVLDYKLFTPGESLRANTLWVLEQIPGTIISHDETATLVSMGYFPSYNIPYFPDIYNMSGYAKQDKPGRNQYRDAPRAKLFARLAHNINTLDEFKMLMRRNDYKHDPESDGNPGSAIQTRYEYRTGNPACFGGLDVKATSYALAKQMVVHAIGGPVYGMSDLNPFDFSTAPADVCNVTHVGVPNRWEFDWYYYPNDPVYPDDSESSSSGLNGAQKAGIIVCVVLVVIIIVLVVVVIIRIRKNKEKEENADSLLRSGTPHSPSFNASEPLLSKP